MLRQDICLVCNDGSTGYYANIWRQFYQKLPKAEEKIPPRTAGDIKRLTGSIFQHSCHYGMPDSLCKYASSAQNTKNWAEKTAIRLVALNAEGTDIQKFLHEMCYFNAPFAAGIERIIRCRQIKNFLFCFGRTGSFSF